jgi:hypothetical protein
MRLDEKLHPAGVTAPAGDRHAGIRAIAHQLNNALVAVLALGSLVADSLQDTEAKRDLDQCVASAKKARDLVKLLFAEADRLDGLPPPGLPPTDEADTASRLDDGVPS